MQLKVGSYHLDVWRESKKKNPKGGRPRIRLNTEQVRKMREEGMSLREIGRELGVSKNTVAKALKGYWFLQFKKIKMFANRENISAFRKMR